MDNDRTTVYTLVDVTGEPDDFPMASTPVEPQVRRLEHQSQTQSATLLENIDFDAPRNLNHDCANKKTTAVAMNTDRSMWEDMSHLVNRHKTPMKPGKFDGTGSLESFLAQFEVCARHNRWTGNDKVDFLRCALDKAATQLLWDFGAREDVSYEQLVQRLRQRYGAEGQAETFRAQLYYRRQRMDESLSDLLHDIRRLVVLAYPVPSSETTEIVARDAFLEAIRDRELSLKVREREPRSIDEAYRMALRLGAYQQMADVDDRRRQPNRVRGTQEVDINQQLQEQLNGFFSAQRKWQQQVEEKMARQLETLRNIHPLINQPSMTPTTVPAGVANGNTGRHRACFNCGRTGHLARQCRQRRRFSGQPRNTETLSAPDNHDEEEVVTNHTTREPRTALNHNAVYVRASINGHPRTCLIDTGSEVSIVPACYVEGLEMQPSTRTLLAANGTAIRVLGELNVPLRFWRGFYLNTSFLVSDQIVEPILGMEWLRAHRCHIGFGTGALFVGRKRIPLVMGNGSSWCRRIVVAEETVVYPRSQCDVPSKTLYGNITVTAPAWMTETSEVAPGIYAARVVVGDTADMTPIRVMNVSEQPTTLSKNQVIGGLYPVEVTEKATEPDEGRRVNELSVVEGLMADVPNEVPTEARERLEHMLKEYVDVFSLTEKDLGRTTVCEHRIDTADSRPVKQPLRRQPFAYGDIIDKQLGQMLQAGVIEPTKSEWAANVVLAKKKDGTLRFCVDYRQLNDRTKKDSYPLPRVDECLDALSGAGWFSTFDLRSGYHQVAMNSESADKTAFVTRRGIFRWRVMPFGLCNAPATFQRMMDIVLSGLNFESCLVYLDDVIVFGQSWEQHLERVELVFQRLRTAKLKLKPSKCHLLRRKVGFLGHVVSTEGIAVDPAKVHEVVEWPTPRRLRDVRAFLGLCAYYRKFILGFSIVAAPLFALTKKDSPFVWDEDCQEAFDRLKSALTSSPILSLPTNEAVYVLDCDASDFGIGAVLSQRIGGDEKVIAYGSRLLSTTERNYCITRKELLAIVHFTKVYRQYLLGRHFVLRTDHAALRWLQKTPEPIGQQGRWLERLSEFDFEIIHRPGRQHGNADALSRKPCKQCGREDGLEVPVLIREVLEVPRTANEGSWVVQAQQADPALRLVRSWLMPGAEIPSLQEILCEGGEVKVLWHQRENLFVKDEILYRRIPEGTEQMLLPKPVREEFLKLAHTGINGGHLGIRRTRWQIRRRAYWIGWSKDVKRYCSHCSQCNQYKRGQPPKQGPLQPIPCGEPWERVSLDISGPFPRSRRGNTYILSVMDNFSKFVEAIPMINQEATTVARALVETVIVRYGTPIQILTDQGRNVDGILLREICKLLQIDKVRTSPYRPSTNGQIERFHRSLNSMLAKSIEESQRDWDDHVPYVLAAFRASCSEATGFSPNRVIFGKENRGPVDLVFGWPKEIEGERPTYTAYVQDLSDKMENAYRLVRENLGKAAERRKHRYDMRVRPKVFENGEWAWYHNPRRYPGRCPKWQKNFTGPFMIIKNCGPVSYLIQRSPRTKPFITHVDKLRPCYGRLKGEWEETVNIPSRDEPAVPGTLPSPQVVDRPRRDRKRPERFQASI